MSKWKRHKKKWSNCTECSLCEGRSRVVLLKGKVPCDVLFVGEAPGVSEDTLGKPFVGPAGKLFEEIVEAAMEGITNVHVAYTTLIACIPKDEDDIKAKEPPKESIKACAERLVEVAELCNPAIVVCVGKLSGKWTRKILKGKDYIFEDVIHPAAILRSKTNQGLAIQQTEVTLRDLFESLVPF